jgi:hypothetical protein
MSNFKIAFESDTIEGLKAIHGIFSGHGSSAAPSSTSETPIPPPAPQPDVENQDASSGTEQAPPPPGETDLDFSNEGVFYPPPPTMSESGIDDPEFEGETAPPPQDNLQDQAGQL